MQMAESFVVVATIPRPFFSRKLCRKAHNSPQESLKSLEKSVFRLFSDSPRDLFQTFGA